MTVRTALRNIPLALYHMHLRKAQENLTLAQEHVADGAYEDAAGCLNAAAAELLGASGLEKRVRSTWYLPCEVPPVKDCALFTRNLARYGLLDRLAIQPHFDIELGSPLRKVAA